MTLICLVAKRLDIIVPLVCLRASGIDFSCCMGRSLQFSTGAGSSLDGGAMPQTSEGVERTADETVAQAAHLFGTDDDLEDNDLLTVRKQDVLGAGCKDVEANGEDSPAKTSKKKKRLKIRPDAASGNRIVFDDGGAALDPLAAFATTDAG